MCLRFFFFFHIFCFWYIEIKKKSKNTFCCFLFEFLPQPTELWLNESNYEILKAEINELKKENEEWKNEIQNLRFEILCKSHSLEESQNKAEKVKI